MSLRDEGLTRFAIFRSQQSVNSLCYVAARDKRHALKIARQHFQLPNTAFAVPAAC